MKMKSRFSLAALMFLAVGGSGPLSAMTWEEAVVASKRWVVAPFIAQAVSLPAEDPETIHLLGRNFGQTSDVVQVAFNEVAAQFQLIDGSHIITRRPVGVAGDKVLVTVTVSGEASDPEDVTTVWAVSNPVDLLQKPGENLWWYEYHSPDRTAKLEWVFSTNAYNHLVARTLDIPQAAYQQALAALR